MRLGNTMFAAGSFFRCGSAFSIIGVPMVPGAMAHTRMPIGARSRAMGSVIPRMAALAAP